MLPAVTQALCPKVHGVPASPTEQNGANVRPEETDDSRRFICEQIRCELVGGLDAQHMQIFGA